MAITVTYQRARMPRRDNCHGRVVAVSFAEVQVLDARIGRLITESESDASDVVSPASEADIPTAPGMDLIGTVTAAGVPSPPSKSKSG